MELAIIFILKQCIFVGGANGREQFWAEGIDRQPLS